MKRNRTIEAIAIQKIEKGIISIQNGHRDGEAVGSDLEYFFNKLKDVNEGMYTELQMRYLIARLELEKNIKESV